LNVHSIPPKYEGKKKEKRKKDKRFVTFFGTQNRSVMNRPEQKYALIRKKKGKRTADPLHRAPVFLGVLYVPPRRSQTRGEVLAGALGAAERTPTRR
jgi:hypothetical protein